MKRFLFSVVVLASLAAANACSSSSGDDSSGDTNPDSGSTSDSGSTLNDSGSPLTDSGSTTNDAATALSFSTDVYTPIIAVHCISCHGPTADGGPGSGIAVGQLDMGTEASAYANLIGDGGVAAAGEACAAKGAAGLKRVAPGDATNSLIYNKVSNNDGDGGTLSGIFCGRAMPLNHPAIPAANQTTIQNWIAEGANP